MKHLSLAFFIFFFFLLVLAVPSRAQASDASCAGVGAQCIASGRCGPPFTPDSVAVPEHECDIFWRNTCCRQLPPCLGLGGRCSATGCNADETNLGPDAFCVGGTRSVSCCLPPGVPPPGGGGGGGGGGPPPPPPRYTISGQVFVDNPGGTDGNLDPGETIYAGATINMTGSKNATAITNSSGNFAFTGLLGGTSYNLSIILPGGYASTDLGYYNISVGPNRFGYNFSITRLYTISGSVFNDINKNTAKDAGETKDWPQAASFSTNGGNLSVDGNAGTFTISDLRAGTYAVSFTSTPLPVDYIFIHPVNGPPPQYSVVVGPGCYVNPPQPNPAGYATCDGEDNVSNLNFAISNSIPWIQAYGGDIRIDTNYKNIIPASPTFLPYSTVLDTGN